MKRPFDIYFNLHSRVYSVLDRRTGRVIDHTPQFTARNCTFIVQPAGRAKVLREKRKAVHAFVRCESYQIERDSNDVAGDVVTYNPYRDACFVYAHDRNKPAQPGDVIGITCEKTLMPILHEANPNAIVLTQQPEWSFHHD